MLNPTLKGEQLRDFRRTAQLVFQNPFDALNPRFTIRRVLAEPLTLRLLIGGAIVLAGTALALGVAQRLPSLRRA